MSLRLEVEKFRHILAGVQLDLYHLSKKAKTVWPEHVLDEVAQEGKSLFEYYMPVDKGTMRDSVHISSGPGWRSIEAHVPYALYVDEGVRPHVIRPKAKKALAFLKEGKIVVRKKVLHPGFPGRRFVDKVFNELRSFAGDKLTMAVDKALEEMNILRTELEERGVYI